jgi:mono/diheme cytochrome c family protein
MPRLAATLALLLAASPALAQTRAEQLAHGRAVAEAWCANCHVVGPEVRRGGDAAPSFASIAARRPEAEQLRTWLGQRHKDAMPRYDLTRTEVANVVAYLLSLR